MIIKSLNFLLSCRACPEQYDVYDIKGDLVGYVRLRSGVLRCDYPDVGGETIYHFNFNDEWMGCFDCEEQRLEHFNNIADKILEKMNKHKN